MNKEIQLLSDEKIREMGKRIKDKRKEKGFKAIDFADIIGIGKDQISRIENGKLPCKTEYLYIMSQVLEEKQEVSHLVCESKEKRKIIKFEEYGGSELCVK